MKALAPLVVGVAIAFASPAHADDPDQHYLNAVRSNGIAGGHDDTLITFAHEWCNSPAVGIQPSQFDLQGQGVWPQQLWTLRTVASKVYCPDRVVAPNSPVYHGLLP